MTFFRGPPACEEVRVEVHIEIKIVEGESLPFEMKCGCGATLADGQFAVVLQIDDTTGFVADDASRTCDSCGTESPVPWLGTEEAALQFAKITKERINREEAIRRMPLVNAPDGLLRPEPIH